MVGTVEQLGQADAEGLRAFLSEEPVLNLYLLGLFEEFGISPPAGRAKFAFHGKKLGGKLMAAVFVGGEGGLIVPSASNPTDVGDIARTLAASQVSLRASLGDRAAVDALTRHLCKTKPKVSRAQRLFAVSADDLGPFTNPTLRLAEETDFDRVLPLACAAVKETIGRDPLEEDATAFRARVLQRIRGRRTYVLELEGSLVFKIDVGSRSQYGAELEGLYTVPHERRQGHATLCLGQISRHLLSSIPRLAVRVDERSEALAAVARKVGYIPKTPQRLVLAE